MTTVSERGQAVIPTNIRKNLDISAGDRFMVLKGDNAGLTLLKIDKMDELMFEISKMKKSSKRFLEVTICQHVKIVNITAQLMKKRVIVLVLK